jgi:integrase
VGRLGIPLGATTVLTGGRHAMLLPPRRDTAASSYMGARMGSIAGADTAVRLIQSGLAVSTSAGYGRLFDAFARYCEEQGVSAPPATTDTVIAYVGYLAELGTWKASSMQPIFSAINDAHRSLDMTPPARDSFFLTRAQRGLGRVQAEVSTSDSRTPLPADDLAAILAATEALPDHQLAQLREGCAVSLTALFAGRQDSAVHLRSADLSVSSSEMWLRLTEKGKRQLSVRRIVRLPLDQPPVRGIASALPRVAALLRRYLALRAASGAAPEFAFQLPGEARPTTSTMEGWFDRCCRRSHIAAPPGFRYMGHSLRSLGASAMAAIGVPRHVYVWLGGWARGSGVVDAHYIDPTFQPSAAAFAFYGWVLTHSYSADSGTVVRTTTLPDPHETAPSPPCTGPTLRDTPPHIRAARRIAAGRR